jgi:MFS family permease
VSAAPAARWPRRLSPRAVVGVLAIVLGLCTVAMVVLSVLSHEEFNGLVALAIGLPSGIVGLLVARRQPANPLGWLLIAIAVCMIAGTDGPDYALLRYHLGYHLPFGVAAVLLGQVWGLGIELLPLVILLFPDGTLPSTGWRGALWAYVSVYALGIASLGVATAVAVIAHPLQVDSNGGPRATDQPTGWYAAVSNLLLLLVLLLTLAFVARQVLSWRRSSGERRQQLKWLASGAAVVVLSPVLASSQSVLPPGLRFLSGLAWFGFAALPVSLGVAILKYRLYDIDRIISRTLAYALVTGLLVGVYAGLVLLATQVLGFASTWAVAASTLAAAALFTPVRRRVQRMVDRRFNRARYDADTLVAAFSDRLKDAVDLAAVRADLVRVTHQALEPAHVAVWFRDGAP